MTATAARRVWLLTAAIAAVGAAVALAASVGADGPALRPGIAWWALAIGFGLAEVFAVHVEFRRDAHTVSLSEVALVLGLFFTSPQGLVAAQVLGAAVALAVHRRQPLLKLAFNLAHFLLEVGLAVLVFRALADLGDGIDGRDWLAAGLAALVTTVVSMACVHTAIALSGGTPAPARSVEALALGTVVTLTNTSLALIAATVRTTEPLGAWLLVGPGLTLFVAYRAYVAHRERTASLQLLHDVGRLLQGTPHVEAAITAVLERTATELRAARAELVVSVAVSPGAEGSGLLRTAVDSTGVIATMEPTIVPAGLTADVLRGAPGAVAGDEVATPLPGEHGVLGALVVADRQGDVTGFAARDLAVLETIAGQVAAWFENSRLERSLQQLTELQAKLEHQALHDPLTGLANRALFTSHVSHALDRRDRRSRPLAVLFLDLDDFKAINDTLGHGVGDSFLVAVAERLRASLRPGDTAARFGGDEFALLLEEIASIDDAEIAASRIGDALRRPFVVDGWEARVGASIGIATSKGGDGLDTPALLRNADLAMYFAKRRGKARHAVFEPSMYDDAMARHEITAELARAIDEGGLVVHYQPIVDLATGAVTGVEALARWDHPGRGLVEPDAFIPVAEDTGLIVPLGDHVLQEACAQGARWQEHVPGLTINVNVSARQLSAPGFVDSVAYALETSGLRHGTLVLEITETALMEGDGVRATLDQVRALGVRLAMDDFGTGYSSLSYLRRFPIDVVKIDKSFVQGVGVSPGDEALASAIVGLTHSLGLSVVAEGVERGEQRARLAELRCNLGQGFWFARPQSPEALTPLIRTGHVGPDLVDLRDASDVRGATAPAG